MHRCWSNRRPKRKEASRWRRHPLSELRFGDRLRQGEGQARPDQATFVLFFLSPANPRFNARTALLQQRQQQRGPDAPTLRFSLYSTQAKAACASPLLDLHSLQLQLSRESSPSWPPKPAQSAWLSVVWLCLWLCHRRCRRHRLNPPFSTSRLDSIQPALPLRYIAFLRTHITAQALSLRFTCVCLLLIGSRRWRRFFTVTFSLPHSFSAQLASSDHPHALTARISRILSHRPFAFSGIIALDHHHRF